ncbi:MAG TPA: hypothetical protein VH089_15150 [Streptosporangiaceae bacterium]|jgi:hypothetical protein|nr:hypothetical protein [Streptosporangiaceae bacterium]
MNDADVIREVRERFEHVHLDTQLETVMSRGRSLRRRRRLRLPVTAVAAVAAVCVALAVAGILPGTGPRSELAAWTVTTKPTGIVTVTIRQLNDPAGLQRTLRADGVRSFVRFRGQVPDWCLNFPQRSGAVLDHVLPRDDDSGPTIALTIDPAAIPSGAALWIQVQPDSTNSSGVGGYALSGQLVYATGQCPAPAGSGGG